MDKTIVCIEETAEKLLIFNVVNLMVLVPIYVSSDAVTHVTENSPAQLLTSFEFLSSSRII